MFIDFKLMAPIPTSGLLRLSLLSPEREVYAMPAKEGELVDRRWNHLLFVSALNELDGYPGGVGNHNEPVWRYPFRSLPVDETKGRKTSAVFLMALPGLAEMIEIDAIRTDGGIAKGSLRACSHTNGLCYWAFSCAPHDIVEFKVSEAKEVYQVRFPIGEIPGLPEYNKGRRNLLDVRIPILEVPLHDGIEGFFGVALLGKFESPRSSSTPLAEKTHRDWTVRRLLDYYYPGQWYVKEGKVRIASPDEATLLRKAIEAVSGMVGR
jgi:hypothetical protein